VTAARPLVPVTEMFLSAVARHGGRVLVHHRSEDWTYARIARAASAVASWLQGIGARRGDRVVVVLTNGADYVSAYFGTLLAGCSVVAVHPETPARELRAVLDHSEAVGVIAAADVVRVLNEVAGGLRHGRAALLCGAEAVPHAVGGRPAASLAALVEHGAPDIAPPNVALDDVAQIIYTSGTTGGPKGVVLTHRNLAANTRSILSYLPLTREDSVLVVLPFFYSYGNSLLLTHVSVGGRLVIAEDFVFWSRVANLADREGVTGLAGVPSTFTMLLFRSNFTTRRLAALRYVTCAGGALPAPMVARLRAALPAVSVFLMYGQTEATARLSALLPHEVAERPESAGRAIPGVELTIWSDDGRRLGPREVGEIVARGENVMRGYWNDADASRLVLRPEGLRTGDLAWMDEDGYLFIVGRKSDIIKSGSYRIGPREIEEVLMGLADVADAAVVGRPDEILGEVPVAFVVPRIKGTCSADAMLEELRRLLPRHKVPREILLVDALPRTGTGKLRRIELQERLRTVAGR